MRRMFVVSIAAAVLLVATLPRVHARAGGQTARSSQTQAAVAGAATSRAWYSVTIVTVKPEMVTAWIDFQKTETIPMQKRGGVRSRDTWQSGAPFGEGFTYGIVTTIDKFADYDQPPLAQRVLGPDVGRAFAERNRKLVAGSRTFAVQDRSELSVMPAANAKIIGAILTDVTVVNGHAEQYEAYLKNDLLPVLKKGNVVGYAVSRTIFGGDANEYHTVQYFDSYAEIDKGPLTRRVLGDAVDALNAKLTPHVARLNRTLIRYVPDLSFRARPAS